MLVAIGLLIILLLITIVFYQSMIAEKVKVEDAEEKLKLHLKEEYGINDGNISAKMSQWQEEGMKLDKKSYFLMDSYTYYRNQFNQKLKKFPFSLLSEWFKVKAVD